MPEKPAYNILHIGYQRTATTWFQKQFFPLVKNVIFLTHDDLPGELFSASDESTHVKLRNHFQAYTRPLIISDENLLGTYSKNNLYSNAYRYKSIFPEAHILIFIRNQVEKYISNYSFYIR